MVSAEPGPAFPFATKPFPFAFHERKLPAEALQLQPAVKTEKGAEGNGRDHKTHVKADQRDRSKHRFLGRYNINVNADDQILTQEPKHIFSQSMTRFTRSAVS